MGILSWIILLGVFLTGFAVFVFLIRKSGCMGIITVSIIIVIYQFVVSVDESDFHKAVLAHGLNCSSANETADILSDQQKEKLKIMSLIRIRLGVGTLYDGFNVLPGVFGMMMGQSFEERLIQLDLRTVIRVVKKKTKEC